MSTSKNSKRGLQVYKERVEQTKIDPVILVPLLYERALELLEDGEKEVIAGHVEMSRTCIAKAIVIVTELQCAIRRDDNSDVADFLRSVYSRILVELSKGASATGGVDCHLARACLRHLRDLWIESTFMATSTRRKGKPKKIGQNHIRLSV